MNQFITFTNHWGHLTWYLNRLPGYQNILWAEPDAILIAIKTIQSTQQHTYIFTNTQKLSNHFWKNVNVPDTQITQTLTFRFAQYTGNHRKNIFWPLKYPNPNCTLCHNNDRDTWPHLLSTCVHPHSKGLRITRHNKANKNTRFCTLTNACNSNNQPPNPTITNMLLRCMCPQRPCQCQAKLRPDILCVIGAPNQIQTPISPSPNYTIQLIEFTYCHDRFPEQVLTHKHTKYGPLNNSIQNNGWRTNPSSQSPRE